MKFLMTLGASLVDALGDMFGLIVFIVAAGIAVWFLFGIVVITVGKQMVLKVFGRIK